MRQRAASTTLASWRAVRGGFFPLCSLFALFLFFLCFFAFPSLFAEATFCAPSLSFYEYEYVLTRGEKSRIFMQVLLWPVGGGMSRWTLMNKKTVTVLRMVALFCKG